MTRFKTFSDGHYLSWWILRRCKTPLDTLRHFHETLRRFVVGSERQWTLKMWSLCWNAPHTQVDRLNITAPQCQSGDFPSQSPPFRGAKYRTSPVRQVRHTASCGFMVDPCGAPWWPLRCNGLDALSAAPYVYVVISPNMPSHIPTEWDPLHTKHSISLQSVWPSEPKMMKMMLLS